MPDGPARARLDRAGATAGHPSGGRHRRARRRRLYNSALVAGPQGYLGTYRKLHLWGDENLYFEPGDLGLPVFHTEFGRLGVAICYDGWFPEVYRLLAMRGA